MWLFAGLGNPGQRYARTRHNFGFRAIDKIVPQGVRFQEGFKGLWTRAEIASEEVFLLKPLTYMNLSGESVSKAMNSLSVPLENLVVFCDDLDLPLGRLRIRKGGSSGGHRGLQSIIDSIGQDGFYRFRLGIGRPVGQDAKDYVLEEFSPQEEPLVEKVLKVVKDAVEVFLKEGPEVAMSQFNGLLIE
ncbi:MAG: aminoacyl-tRNA hydrolase [Nitrospirae bacterium]|nr:MAG: aminoacyl-tRNA hydrolase [Nitrospirota bacterium]